MKTVLLAGCGKIGLALGQALLQAGFQPIGLRRSQVPAAFPLLQADFTRPLDPALFRTPIDYVVHTATPAARSDEAYAKAYPGSVRHLLAALQDHPLQRFFFVSSTAVYGQQQGEWVDETSPAEPQQFNGVRMLEAETLLRHSGVPATCVRFGGIYGQGGNFLIRKIQAGTEVQREPPAYTNRIHHDDCVGMLQFLLEQAAAGTALEPVYLGVDDEPVSEDVLYQWLAQRLGAPAPVPVTRPGAPQNKRCSNARIRALGYRFRYPDFRSGYAALLEH